MRRLPTLLLLALLAFPGAAAASSTQLTIAQDDRRLVYSGEGQRAHTLGELDRLGVDVVKVHVYWSEVAPTGTRRPAGFEGWKVEDYRDEAFHRHDDLIRRATALGMRVLVSPTAPAPGWATAKRGDRAGVWKPSAREFGRFVRSLATRWDGRHADAAGNPLPRVDMWSIWNEPNHPLFLQPLGSSSQRRALAPHLYRDLLRHAVSGLRLTGHANDTILFGELLPIGHSRFGSRNTIKPVTFIRELFCLDARWRPYRGSAARARNCDGFRRLGGVSGFGYHPYTRPSGPWTREPSSADATIRSLGRISGALDRAASRGRVRRGLGIWNTEFGFQSDPPDPYFGARLSRIPTWLNESELISFANARVKSWSQYALIDDPLRAGRGRERYSGFQTGLYFSDGRRKNAVYDAWRVPLVVRLRGRTTIEAWGAVRPEGSVGRTVELQQRLGGGGYRTLRTLAIGNPRGYVRVRVRLSRPDDRVYRLVYRTPEGATLTSRSTRARR
jgi:hypothetical protein